MSELGKPNETRLRVLECVVTAMENSRTAPTRDEIAAAVGLGSRSSIQYHIDTLVEDGYIERATYRHRMLRPTESGINAIARLKEIDGTAS